MFLHVMLYLTGGVCFVSIRVTSVFRGTQCVNSSLVYILYAKSSHEQTGNIITFSHFEEEDLVKNECNAAECESVLDLI